MRHPLALVPDQYRKRIFLVFLVLTVMLFLVFQLLDEPLRTDAAPLGIVSFELAGDPGAAAAITDSWKHMNPPPGAAAGQPDASIASIPYMMAAFGLGLDYLFMPVYAMAIAMGSLLAAQRRDDQVGSWGALAGYAAFFAVLFDATENYALLNVLSGKLQSGYPALAATCAVFKFGLIAFSLLYIVVARLLPTPPKH